MAAPVNSRRCFNSESELLDAIQHPAAAAGIRVDDRADRRRSDAGHSDGRDRFIRGIAGRFVGRHVRHVMARCRPLTGDGQCHHHPHGHRGRGIERAAYRRFPGEHLYGAASGKIRVRALVVMGAVAHAISHGRMDMVRHAAGKIFIMTGRLKMVGTGVLLLASGFSLFTGCTSFQVLNSTVPKSCYIATLDMAYGNNARQRLDVYRPRKAGNGKVVVFFYGGSWRTGSKTDYRFVAEALTSRGFIAVLPDYRVYPEVMFPKFVEDSATAVRWVHDHISRFSGDTNHIYLMGHSAGAHIAALLTLDAHYLADAGLERKTIRATAGLSIACPLATGADDLPVLGH